MVLGLPLPRGLGSRKTRCSSQELSLSNLEECRRDNEGRKGVKGLLLVGHEKVPHGFGLRTGGRRNTADGTGNCGRPANGAQITGKNQESSRAMDFYFFPRSGSPYWPGWVKGEGRIMCVCGYFKELWDF